MLFLRIIKRIFTTLLIKNVIVSFTLRIIWCVIKYHSNSRMQVCHLSGDQMDFMHFMTACLFSLSNTHA